MPAPPAAMPVILYEDGDLIALDKPDGTASIPGRGPRQGSLLDDLQRVLPGRPFIVHRLDREVSGVILFAKNERAHRALNVQFERREVRKTYLALLAGAVDGDQGVIDRPVRQFGSGRMGVDPRGKPSITEYRVRERFPEHTLVEAEPLTGRRHQLRVHFYSSGHPIAGDMRYGDRALQERVGRLMLHALRIRFRTPAGQELVLEAPLPASFLRVLEQVRAAAGQRRPERPPSQGL